MSQRGVAAIKAAFSNPKRGSTLERHATIASQLASSKAGSGELRCIYDCNNYDWIASYVNC